MIIIAKWIDISRTPEFNPARVHRNLLELEGSMGSLAWAEKVEQAMLGETVIQGGFLKTELIKVADLIADNSINVWAQEKVDEHNKNESPHNLPSYARMEHDGFKVYDDQGNLRTHMGQYTPGKYGLKVIDGEIYSTKFKTGSETATNYIQLSPGDAPLEVIKDNKEALSIWTSSLGGMIQFYNTSLDDMAGQILPYDDSAGQGLRIEGRTLRGSQTDVDIGGRTLTLNASNGVNMRAGNGYFDMQGYTVINGGLDVGPSGTKNCIEETSQGLVALSARESPEVRYVDEGRADLVDGCCRIDVDPLFMECIITDAPETPWHISLTPMGPFVLYVDEIGNGYFVVKSVNESANGKFTWALSAVRKNYAGVRLQKR